MTAEGLTEAERERREVAYLLWQIGEGYILAEDRAVGDNWMLRDPATLHPDDVAELPGWLDSADVVLAILAKRLAAVQAERDALRERVEALADEWMTATCITDGAPCSFHRHADGYASDLRAALDG